MSYSKEACLRRIVPVKDRCWDDCQRAWDQLNDFMVPRLEEGSELKVSVYRWDPDKWFQLAVPACDQIRKLGFRPREVKYMLKSGFWEARKNMKRLASDSQAQVNTPRKRPRSRTSSTTTNPDTALPPPPTVKRAKTENRGNSLPHSIKIYFMEVGNPNSRTGVPISVLSNDKEPGSESLEIRSLGFGKLTQLLKKRSVYQKETHEIFYHDLENPAVTVIVDNCFSLRAGVQEMAAQIGLGRQIEFGFAREFCYPGES